MRFRLRRKTKRFFKRLLLASPLFGIGWILYLLFRSPSSAPPANITVQMTPDRIERGQYLFNAVCACADCHSERDYKKFGAPVSQKDIGKGQIVPFNGLPGNITAANLTNDRETGLGRWTDGEKIRAIREGISKDGRALYPLMPYQYYRYLSDEDVESIVAYMNSLPKVKNPLPRTRVSFPTTVWIKSLPAPVLPVPPVDPDAGEAYGDYLTKIAACEFCHTPHQSFQPDLKRRFAGGDEMDTFFGLSIASNISSDPDTGIGKWVYLQFEQRMRDYRRYEGHPPDLQPRDFTMMPWEAYSQLNDHDLELMFIYLRGQKPINNSVPGAKIFPGLTPIPIPVVPTPAPSQRPTPALPEINSSYARPSVGSAPIPHDGPIKTTERPAR